MRRNQTAAPAAKPASSQSPKQRKIGDVNFSGSLRLRVENYGWFETPGFEDDYTFGAAVLRLSLGQQKERYDWQVEGEFPVLFNLPERDLLLRAALGFSETAPRASAKQIGIRELAYGAMTVPAIAAGHLLAW